MGLFIEESDVVEIKVWAKEGPAKEMLYFDKEEPDCAVETFTFRRTTWDDTKILTASLASSVVRPSVVTNDMNVNPADAMRFVDVKIKTLLKDWTLQTKEGKKRPVSKENIGKLDPVLVQHLFARLSNLPGQTI
jgi:hypothetical protein